MPTPDSVRIVPLADAPAAARGAMAAVLVAAFAHADTAWRDMAAAREEVATFDTDPERLALVALGDAPDAEVLGWVGAIRDSEHLWELHPLAVAPAHQGRGVGTRLVRALEGAAAAAGAATIWLGTDDDFGGTTLAGADLFPDPLGALARLAARAGTPVRHPFAFYRRLGYAVVGVLPDAGGFGRPDILMARRVIEPVEGAA